MREPTLVEQQRQVVDDLQRLIANRARSEVAIESAYLARTEAAETEYREDRPRSAERLEGERQAAEKQYQELCQSLTAHAAAELEAAEADLSAARENIEQEYEEAKTGAKQDLHDSGWTLSALSEADKATTDEPFKEAQKRVAVEAQRLNAVVDEAKKTLARWRQSGCAKRVRISQAPYESDAEPLREMQECITEAEMHLELLQQLVLPRLFRGYRVLWLFLILWLLFIYPAGWLWGSWQSPSDLWTGTAWLADWPTWLGLSLAAALAVGLILAVSLYFAARERILTVYQPLCQFAHDAELSRKEFLDRAEAQFQKN